MSAPAYIDFTTVAETSNPDGLPGGWPAEQRGINDVNAPLTFAINHRMSWADYLAYLAPMQNAYNTRAEEINAAEQVTQLAIAQAAKEAAEPDLVTLRDQAQNALTDNDTYLAILAPTNNQVLAQVRRLTQQNSKIIKALYRLVTQDLSS